ncbi:hypothetical protein HNY73_010289 [Argiope bruennichi]|uniref:Reverse transcriptase domain-containing protein n=1 Tax=Argiope bruennichi TaxID=94029 RepID=A0A8T0F2Y4_ARGBR|nr:hypothetical protein HNY73_010289 [Argiope bruennichi]
MLEKSLYVDDLICSQRDFDSAFKTSLECFNVFKEESMELRKWKTNSVELRDKWREAGLEIDEEKYSINDNSALTPCKVLGLAWDSDLDVFPFDTRSSEKFLSKTVESSPGPSIQVLRPLESEVSATTTAEAEMEEFTAQLERR